jgi:hypothetical protein
MPVHHLRLITRHALVSGDLGAKVMRSAPPALTGLLLTLTLEIEAATPNTN